MRAEEDHQSEDEPEHREAFVPAGWLTTLAIAGVSFVHCYRLRRNHPTAATFAPYPLPP
jgi:hypothetical protein